MSDENEQIKQRREKLDALRRGGFGFPNDFKPTHLVSDIVGSYGEWDGQKLDVAPISVKITGRMMSRRTMGKSTFADVQDRSGRIQIFVQRDNLENGFYNEQFKKWDIGDIVGVAGTLFRTRTGELSVRVDEIRLLTKSLRPLPEKFHGLSDQELRYRQRYVDLIVNPGARRIFQLRARIIEFIRWFFIERGFLEVETPMMQAIPGGAVARPFVTHHNALDMDLYLRVAPELFLKRLVVGGFDRVFEINRNFRNEGVSTQHNPEFTMLEFYQAYADYADLMDLTEILLRELTGEVLGGGSFQYQDQAISLEEPFKRLSVTEAVLERNPGLDAADTGDRQRLSEYGRSLEIEAQGHWGEGKWLMEIFEKTVEDRLIQPTFVTLFPLEVSPLSRVNDDNPAVTDRFELFIAGREIANGFSELNDAEDQAERFQRQVADKQAGDEEAMHFDHDYIRALEHGLPPTAGEGIGIDRLVMLLADCPSIRDVLLFPHMRPESTVS
ncbi:MAG: Lysine--tRNA ligase, heat inducible [Gammaproteobacteria bacterium]|nr:Lysine--tRNA ligase, heat inducible [Gammaproteobacteria bacterium]